MKTQDANSAPAVYLAGPDVFFPDCWTLAGAKRNICAEHGLRGVFPLDGLRIPQGVSEDEVTYQIYCQQADKVADSDIVIANLTPYPSRTRLAADNGTAFELGFAAGFNAALAFTQAAQPHKIIVCYSNDHRPLSRRLHEIAGVMVTADENGVPRDSDGYMVDSLEGPDNLMLDGGARRAGGRVFVPAAPLPEAEYYTSLVTFRQAVEHAARLAVQRGMLKGPLP